jgi:hypothetical protein
MTRLGQIPQSVVVCQRSFSHLPPSVRKLENVAKHKRAKCAKCVVFSKIAETLHVVIVNMVSGVVNQKKNGMPLVTV